MKHNATVNLTGVDVLDDKQVSALLNTNPRTLRLWRHTRGLPFVRITSKVIRYRRADIDDWLARRRVAIAA
jgi:predicted DNA-binding transcriptional regulator AlpA